MQQAASADEPLEKPVDIDQWKVRRLLLEMTEVPFMVLTIVDGEVKVYERDLTENDRRKIRAQVNQIQGE